MLRETTRSRSRKEDEDETIKRNQGVDNGEFYDRLGMLFNHCPDFGDRIKAGEDITCYIKPGEGVKRQ